jgi:hypothetical protein
MFMMLIDHLEQLSWHIDDVVPQPAHKSQLAAWSADGELWQRATVPLVGPAKPQVLPLTWRGCGALEDASIARSSEPSKTSFVIRTRKG